MSLRYRPLRTITSTDLQGLLADGIEEQVDLEYKETWPAGTEEDKIKFLAAVTSVANTVGGDVIFGVSAPKGVPVAIPGLGISEIDDGKRRLNQLLESRVEPRIIGLDMQSVDMGGGRACLIVRAPTSLLRPHGVKVNDFWRFWGRNSGGKYPLNVGELRVAFSATESLAERARRFRAERLSRIDAGESPVALKVPSALVVHLVPFSAFEAGANVDVSLVERLSLATVPLYGGGVNLRFNLEGHLSWVAEADKHAPTYAYCQVFRSGAIEA